MSENDRAGSDESKKHVREIVEAVVERWTTTMLTDFDEYMREWKRDRRWKWAKRLMYAVAIVGITTAQLMYFGRMVGYSSIPSGQTVAVVPIRGGIAQGAPASADAILPVLERLFQAESISAIVLQVESGGGAPTEADRINRFIATQKAKTGKKVIAVCESICASAAYMIAMHADKVYAGRYSWVGSIGAIMKAWNLSRLTDKFEVQQLVFASGPLKNMGNMFSPMTDDQVTKMQNLVTQAASTFEAEVKAVRGDKLSKGTQIFTGEVWDGDQALQLGLTDGVATLEEAISNEFGDVETQTFPPVLVQSGLLDKLFTAVGLPPVAGTSSGPVSFEYGY